MGLEQNVENWLFSVAAKKVAWAISKAIISILVSVKVEGVLKQHGISIDIPAITVSLPATIFGIMEGAHDWLRVKTGKNWL